MIILYHHNNGIQELVSDKEECIDFDKGITIAKGLQILASKFPNDILVWCQVDCKEQLNAEVIETLFHHSKLMLSYHPHEHHFIDKRVGYVDDTLFVNINKKATYPTWHMSSLVGAVHASVLLAVGKHVPLDSDFDYYLNSLAKLAMPLGLFCYSEPHLLKDEVKLPVSKTNLYKLFRFVKQHYKTRWLFLLVLNLLFYEKRLVIIPFLYAFGFGSRTNRTMNLDAIAVKSSKDLANKASIDVIIPTIGRKTYLYDVLCDLRNQTHLPENVIIVEQNPKADSVSELDYVTSESWPFKIKHIFTHQTGACHARNRALEEVTGDWVFLADDDNRLESNLLEKVFQNINKYGVNCVTTSYPQKNESIENIYVSQSPNFGSGNSFLRSCFLKKVQFNMSFEHGYGEDADFGMQLRNNGIDVIYLPEPSILHLKAPMGGFRTKPKVLWQDEAIQPKPSPTVMLFQLLHRTKEQRLGYKTVLFLKYYKNQSIKNPFTYFKVFKKQWQQSLKYAHHLKSIKPL
ncbi:glycosyltransferase family 2 protein [Flavobacteriaceae bacterium XHP0103]|uniref:glycosyltransferase family 2 protein n=1 Tax=Marixanthotalea marina TaxID=2844359 RepID=UPI002989E936|nr:glycosyltransferase family A protein [Marixanthotalea marina]MBU3822726.1 glycosyltransferase family 2 protein [Marixanthotalea marina]